MSHHPYEGKIVVLPENFQAWDTDGKEIRVSGPYELVEFMAYEPAAYVWSDCWIAVPEGTPLDDVDWQDASVTLDAMDVWAVMDPEGYKREMELEKEMAEAAELEWE